MPSQGWGWNNVRHPVLESGFPNSPTCRVHFSQGYGNNNVMPGTAGSSNGTNYWNGDLMASNEIYLTALIKLSGGFVNGGGGLKIISVMHHDAGGPTQWGHVSAFGGHTVATKGQMAVRYSHKIILGPGGGNNTPQELHGNQGRSTRLALNTVHRIEFYGRVSSGPNVADGIVRLWLNGQLIIDYTNLVYYTDPSLPHNYRDFVGTRWFPSIGGRTDGNDPAQDFWLDNVYVSQP